MKKSYQLGFFGALLYIAIELGVYFTGWNHHPMKHLIAFATSSLILLISVTFSIVMGYQSVKHTFPSFILDLKNGIQTAAIYALIVAIFSFVYYKWIDDYAQVKKQQLLEMAMDEKAMKKIAKEQIENNPAYYDGKSPEDLIDMQQENISANMSAGVIFPFTLFTQLLLGMIYTFLIMALNRLLLSKL